MRTLVRQEDGVAIVAAVGVAMIGIVLTLLVVTQVIIVTQDSGRDRIRTAEIHGAEGALDSAIYELQQFLPCESSLNGVTVGSGATETRVEVTIAYFDSARTPLTCTGDFVQGDAVYAVLTAHSTAVQPSQGVSPERTIEATVRITPRQGLATGTSLFSASGMQGTNSGRIIPSNPDERAGLWVDSGNFQCNNSFRVDGDVVVPAGSITTTNSCQITGSAWARTGFSDSSGSTSTPRVIGDVTVRQGNMSVGNPSRFGGSLHINGNITGWHFQSTNVAGTICANSIENPPPGKTYAPCNGYTEFQQRGFPQITWSPQDWIDEGFTVKPRSGGTSWTQDVINGWDLNTRPAWVEDQYRGQPCTLATHLSNSPINLSSTPSLYDLRDCDLQTNSGVTLRLYADTAIFARSINLVNTTTFLSGDGGAHRLWLIVPHGSSGGLNTSNQLRIESPLAAFYYSPNQLNISNNQAVRGQIYGRNLNVSNNFQLEHVSIGVPGVDLGSIGLDVTSSGFMIDVLSKRERQQS